MAAEQINTFNSPVSASCPNRTSALRSAQEKQVEEPKPAETFSLAWRTGEEGAALKWWLDRLRKTALLERLTSVISQETRQMASWW